MFIFCAVDISKDRDILLEFHCRANYESETPFARTAPYEKYREKWLSISQPESYLSDLARTMKDSRTIAEIVEDNGVVVGYSWVLFVDIESYNITIAEIMDIAVAHAINAVVLGLKL